ncbi:MAG: serine/threonine protein kinase, partial [Gammaproteobacteria bacterium]|nr:serine/threonine protein kinase [Gammaproteobacteria bacterium]
KRSLGLNVRQRDGLQIIDQSGHHLLTLINDILDLSKIEARKMTLFPEDLNLQNFLDGIEGLMRMRAQEKDLLFQFESQDPLPQGLKADEKRLRQVLINLLGNALKFTDQGSVTLRVSVMGHSSEKEAALRFEIIDTGVGLTPENLEKIFQPFEQVGDTDRQIEGTGLGLAITRQLVTLMGGELHVKSQAGQGSTFWFEATFPIVAAEVRSSAAAPLRVRGYKGARRAILIVDGKEVNCLVLRDFLEP